MAYDHGISIQEQPTSIISPVLSDAGLPVVFGTAPLNLTSDLTNVNKPVLCYSYDEAVKAFGYSSDFANYTLCEQIKVHFALFNVAPIVLINVLDPATHKISVTAEAKTLVNGKATLSLKGVVLSSVVVKVATVTQVLNTDYTLAFDSEGNCVISRVTTGTMADGATLSIDYDHLNPSAITSTNIVGGIDGSGVATGLELIEEIFPRFRLVPGQIAAPKFSKDPTVAAVMVAKANNINGLFKAIAVADLDDSTATLYTAAPAWKNTNNYIDKNLFVTYGKVKLGTEEYHLSTQAVSLICKIDADNGGIPYVSPSNKSLQANALLINDVETFLSLDKANYLNGEGIATAINFIGGWKLWGVQTSAYPASTDVKDVDLAVRRMFNWLNNTIILTYWQKVDSPLNRRLTETVIDSINIWLNGLTAKEVILGGRVEFKPEENPTTDLLAGIVRFHLYVTPPTTARQIDFMLEYDVNYLNGLFA